MPSTLIACFSEFYSQAEGIIVIYDGYITLCEAEYISQSSFKIIKVLGYKRKPKNSINETKLQ